MKLYVRHGMIADKIHELNSFKQSQCLGKNISFNTQKRNKAGNEFEKKTSINYLKRHFMEKNRKCTGSFEIRNYIKK